MTEAPNVWEAAARYAETGMMFAGRDATVPGISAPTAAGLRMVLASDYTAGDYFTAAERGRLGAAAGILERVVLAAACTPGADEKGTRP